MQKKSKGVLSKLVKLLLLKKENAKIYFISASVSCAIALLFRYLKFKKAKELEKLKGQEVLTQESLDQMNVNGVKAHLEKNGPTILFSGKLKINKTDYILTNGARAVYIVEKHKKLEVKNQTK